MKGLLKFAGKCVLLTLALIVILGALIVPAAERSAGGIYDKTLRFHVLAASDGEEDQALKLKVRDGLLSYLAPLIKDCGNAEACEKIAAGVKDELKEEAERILREQGSAMPVRVEIGEEYYPTRTYEGYSYPAGEYRSLRVLIGEAQGENWWCVVFPPLCLQPSGAEAETTGYTESETATVKKEGAGEVRFFLLDLIGRIRSWFS